MSKILGVSGPAKVFGIAPGKVLGVSFEEASSRSYIRPVIYDDIMITTASASLTVILVFQEGGY